jgi:hypothetical protein
MGFTLNDVETMTLQQVNLFMTAGNKRNRSDFKNDVYGSMLGSRGSPEEINKLFNT